MLGIDHSNHEEREFEDGEHKSRSLANVRGRDVFVVQSLCGDERMSVNDKLCRLLFFLGSLKDAGAMRTTAVVPYLCYMRKDRKTKPRDPVTTRYLARLFEAVETDRIMTIDVQNLQAYQNGFRCRTEHLEAQPLFVDYCTEAFGNSDLAVMSPDAGGVKPAEQFRQRLERAMNRDIPLVFMEKQRSGDVVSGETVVGAVEGKTVIVIDDMISSGTTVQRAAKGCLERGAVEVRALATHAAFTEKTEHNLRDPVIERVAVTNTIPMVRGSGDLGGGKLDLLDAAPLFAEAIKRVHNGGSLVELLNSVDR